MRAGALVSALSLKLKQGQLLIVDTFELAEIKTKNLAAILTVLEAKNSLIVDAKANEKLRISARNIPKSHFLPPEGVNLYDVLRHENLILTKEAATELQNRLQGI
jgi:large subunit ribosomal protein L4